MADVRVPPDARRKPSALAVPRSRRTQAARSGEMKRRILDAAFAVLKERGFAGFTTAEVARRAGVSRGAQVHHFPSKNDLVTAAMEHVFGIALADGLRLAQAAKRSARPVDALISDAQAFYFSDYFYVGLDMLIAGGKDPALKQSGIRVVRNYRRPVEQQWLAVIQELGLPAPISEDLLLLTVSLVRGFGIRQLWSSEPERVQALLALWQDMIDTYVAAKVPAKAAAPIGKPPRKGTRA